MIDLNNKKLNTIELFAGCGGLLDGFEKTNLYNTLACVEWKKDQCNTLVNRLEKKYNYKDAKKRVLNFDLQRTEELINGWDQDDVYGSNKGLKYIIKNNVVDLITGGPPCQAYSIAGRIQDENGMRNDYRNYLFESYLKIVGQFNPKLIVFENVPGILSAKPDGFNIIDRIKSEFNTYGFDIINNIKQNALLNLSDFGIPQKRERVILVGLNKKYFKGDNQKLLEEFYNSILSKYKVVKKSTVYDAIIDLPKIIPVEKEYKVGRKKYSHTPNCSNINGHYPRYHNKRDIGIFRELAIDIETGENKYSSTEALKKLYTERTGKVSNIHKYNVLKWNELSNTIPAHLKKDGLRHIHPDSEQARTITVREAARLQTFDDDFEFVGSMSSCYEMIGNAVPPMFSMILGKSIHELLYRIINKKNEI